MKYFISNILIFCGLLFWPLMSYSQRSISGNIIDENNKGIADASIIIKNSQLGTRSNLDGSFSLSLPEQLKSIIVSAEGFETQEINIGAKSFFDIKMTKNYKQKTQQHLRPLECTDLSLRSSLLS